MRAWRMAAIAPASSTMRMITPPCTLPSAFACSGSIKWCSVTLDSADDFASVIGGTLSSIMQLEATSPARTRIGFIGTGIMGGAMALHLVRRRLFAGGAQSHQAQGRRAHPAWRPLV